MSSPSTLRRRRLRNGGRRLAATVAATAAAAAATMTALPASAAPVMPAVRPGCSFEQDVARAWESPADGRVRGFYSVHGNESFSCDDGTIYWFERVGSTWRSVRSPYRGRVMSVTGDGSGTYLLYAGTEGIWITKRDAAGVFTAGRRLSPLGLGTRIRPTGDVAARGGKWWAVWTENDTPTRHGQTELYQAKSIGTPVARTRLTVTPNLDETPSIALRPDNGAVLVWARHHLGDDVGSVVRIARSSDGSWSSAALATSAGATQPDVLVTGRTTAVAYGDRNASLTYADDSSGRFAARPFALRAGSPYLATSGGRLFVGATGRMGVPYLYTRGTDGRWTGSLVAGSAIDRFVHTVTASGGQATVTFTDGTQLLARRTG